MKPVIRAVEEDTDAIVAALHELIEALDRRIPHVERVGERAIREQAAELRKQAVRRIDELTRANTKH
jgi:uncharacterized protein YdcH (DUF465 family)